MFSKNDRSNTVLSALHALSKSVSSRAAVCFLFPLYLGVCLQMNASENEVTKMVLCDFWGQFMVGDVNSSSLSLSISLSPFLSCRRGALGPLSCHIANQLYYSRNTI